MKHHTQSPHLIAIVLLLVAVADMPYGYYTFLRIAVTLTAGWQMAIAFSTGGTGWLPFAAIAILFNPIIPVHLTREIWMVLNLIAAGLFGYAVYANLRLRRMGFLPGPSVREGDKGLIRHDGEPDQKRLTDSSARQRIEKE